LGKIEIEPCESEEVVRKKEREITDKKEIEAIIQKAEVCRLGMAVDNMPYVVPVNYGYDGKYLYIHCSRQGRKLDMIRKNKRVCFEISVDAEIRNRDKPACDWSTAYRSVIGYGDAYIIDDFDQKKQALDVIMAHYAGEAAAPFEYRRSSVENVGIIKIAVLSFCGKKSG
jgi:uncharacterized protein